MNQNDAPSLFTLIKFARLHRKNPTPSESILWSRIRGRKLGAYFRRQHPIDRYIVDFYCSTHRLVVEVDGGSHHDKLDYDIERQRIVELHGIRFVRIEASLVERDVHAAIALVREALER